MAKNNSRMDSMEEQLASLLMKQTQWEGNQAEMIRIRGYQENCSKQLEEMREAHQETRGQVEMILHRMDELCRLQKGKDPVIEVPTSSQFPSPKGPNTINNTPGPNLNIGMTNQGPINVRVPRFDFPKFNGENPRVWIRKCHKYFLVHPMNEFEKILTSAMHMEGVADNWYLDYVEGRELMGWQHFTEMVITRFSSTQQENLVGKFNKLTQTESVEEYVEKFEELKAFMVSTNRFLTEEYFIKSFISGLKLELAQMVDMLNPLSLAQAMHLARKQEGLLEAMSKGGKNQYKNQHPVTGNKGGKPENFQAPLNRKSNSVTEPRYPLSRD